MMATLDNRPLDFGEWEERTRQVTYVSATPGDYELDQTEGVVTEQIIRPTGLLDPEIEIRPISGQVDDLYDEIKKRAADEERVSGLGALGEGELADRVGPELEGLGDLPVQRAEAVLRE